MDVYRLVQDDKVRIKIYYKKGSFELAQAIHARFFTRLTEYLDTYWKGKGLTLDDFEIELKEKFI